MTNTYDTSNEPLGSTAVKVLYNNASNLDDAVNSEEDTWVDRPPFGRIRRTWRGMENAFDQFLLNSGYEFLGDYDADGPLTITRPNQIFSKDGEYWRSGPGLDLPYTTVNNWTVDEPKFVSVGDASLRQALASTSGWSMVGAGSYGTVEEAIETVADDLDLSAKVIDGTGTQTTAAAVSLQLMIKNHIDASWYGFKSGRTPLEQANALQAAASAAKAENKRLFVPRDNYTLSKGVLIETPFTMDGGTLDFSSGTDFSATGMTALKIAGQGLTQLPNLASNVSRYALELPLTSAPASIGPGDIICIHNDTPGSWNAARTYYQAGEYCLVNNIVGNSIRLASPLAESYTSASVKVYKVNFLKGDFDFNGTELIGPPISFLYGVGAEFVNVGRSNVYGLTARNANLTQIQYTQSIDIDSFGLRAYELENTTTGNDYGLALINSQGMRIHGGEFISSRHGVAMGGLTGPGSVVNRYNDIIGARIASRGASAVAADFHGNSDSCSYQSCRIEGGGSVGGNANAYRNCDIISSTDGYIFFGSELKGTDHKFSGNRCTMKSAPASGFGAVNIRINANCNRGGTLDFSDLKISGADFAQFPILIEDSGSPATDRGVRINDLDIKAPSSLQFLRMLGTVSVPWNNLTLGVVTTNGNASPSVTNTTTKVRIPAPVAF